MLYKQFKKHFIFLVSISLLSIVYAYDIAVIFLQKSNITGLGGDTSGHYTLYKYYSENIFPNIFGWAPGWNLGMPWPNGYNPISSLIMSVVDIISPMDFILDFKILIITVGLTLPIFIYISVIRMGGNRFAALLSSSLLIVWFSYGPDSSSFIYKSLFSYGYVTLFFGATFYIIFLPYLVNTKNTKHYFWLSVGMFIIALTNSHIFILSLISILFSLIANYKSVGFRELKLLLISAVNTFLLGSFWIIPYLATSNYFPSKTMASNTSLALSNLQSNPYILLIFLVGAIRVIAKINDKNLNALLSTSIGVTLITLLPVNDFTQGTPWQPDRIFDMLPIISFISTGILLSHINRQTIVNRLIPIVIILLIIFLPPGRIIGIKEYIKEFSQEDRQLLTYLENTKGRSLVEFNDDINTNLNAISNHVGLIEGHQSFWGTFRESSINSAFIHPMGDYYSLGKDDFGIVCPLCKSQGYRQIYEPFHANSYEDNLKRASLLGIDYLTLSSEYAKNNANQTDLLELEFSNHKWSVYKLKTESLLSDLAMEPVLTLTDLNSRSRDIISGYDWLRINEEWFTQNDLEFIFVQATPYNLINQSDYFNNLFIINYNDLTVATLNSIVEISNSGKNVYLLQDDSNKNFQYLLSKLDGSQNMKVISNSDISESIMQINYHISEESYKQSTVQIADEFIRYESTNNYYYLQTSYFPWLIDKNGGEVFNSSPNITLVVNNAEEPNIEFIQPRYAMLASLVTILSMIGNITFLIFVYSKKKLLNSE